jgi:hypothetical protein
LRTFTRSINETRINTPMPTPSATASPALDICYLGWATRRA